MRETPLLLRSCLTGHAATGACRVGDVRTSSCSVAWSAGPVVLSIRTRPCLAGLGRRPAGQRPKLGGGGTSRPLVGWLASALLHPGCPSSDEAGTRSWVESFRWAPFPGVRLERRRVGAWW